MPDKVTDIQKARQDKLQKTGWTHAEIKKRTAEERVTYAKLAENVPDALASGGDVANIMDDKSDEED